MQVHVSQGQKVDKDVCPARGFLVAFLVRIFSNGVHTSQFPNLDCNMSKFNIVSTSAASLRVSQVIGIPCATFAAKTSANKNAPKAVVKKTHSSPVGTKESLLYQLHQVRLEGWKDSSAQRVKAGKSSLPEDIPEDVAFKPEMWPSGARVTGLTAYRKAWTGLPEPTYWTIVRSSDKGGRPTYFGVFTHRGITEPNSRFIRQSRKRDWVVTKDGAPDFTAWESIKTELGAPVEAAPAEGEAEAK